jgi:DNA invertase Pin-like site-specific DNA recombinase
MVTSGLDRVHDSVDSVTLQVMRLIAYLRVSSAGQLDGYGLDAQERDVRAYARRNGHRIVALHVDGGVSGALDALDRPGLADVLTALRERPLKADGLLVPRLDRLARALTVQEAALALVWREGLEAHAADTGVIPRDDPDDPMRTAMRQMMGVFAELDRRTIVKRLRDGRRAKAATGRKAVGQYAYGFEGQGRGRDRDAAPCDDEQTTVRRVLTLRAAGRSYREIAATLDSEGRRPRRATSWSPMSVRSDQHRPEAASQAR